MTASSEQPKQEVLLVDLSGLFWRSWMSNGETLKARDNTLALIRRCMEGCGFQAPVAICLDRGRSFRKDIADTYKATRPEKDLQAVDELRKTERMLADEGFTTWGVDGFEADDIIATATQKAVAAGHPVRIASSDKDLLQLVATDGVRVIRPHIGSSYADPWGKAEVMAEFGIPPYLLGDWLALVGDSSDNIRGAPGVGPKSATGFLMAYPGLGHLFEGCRAGVAGQISGIRSAAKLAAAIAANEADIRLARKLVELRFDAPIDFEEIYRPRERRRQPDQPPQEDEMTATNELTQEGDGAPGSAQETPKAAGAESPTPAPIAPQAAVPAATPPAAPAPAKSTALAVVVPEVIAPRFELALEPVNASQARNMAGVLWKSGLYGKFPTEEALYAVITRGRELGIPALAALDCFHYFEEKLALHAHLIRHLAQSDPNCEWFLPCPAEGDDKNKVARWGTKHRGISEPIFHTYTIEDAVNAGLCQLEIVPRDWTIDPKTGKPDKDRRNNWDKRRPELLDKTCSSQLARRVYPGRAMGLYSLAELGGDEA